MEPGLTIYGPDLSRTEETAYGDTAEIPGGHSAVMIGFTKEVASSPQTAEQQGSFCLVYRTGTRVLGQQLL